MTADLKYDFPAPGVIGIRMRSTHKARVDTSLLVLSEVTRGNSADLTCPSSQVSDTITCSCRSEVRSTTLGGFCLEKDGGACLTVVQAPAVVSQSESTDIV